MNQIPVASPPPSGEEISLWSINPLPSILLPFQRDTPDLNRIQVINSRIILAIRPPGSFAPAYRWLAHYPICHPTIMNLNSTIVLTLNVTINQHSSTGIRSISPTYDFRYMPTVPLLNHARILTLMELYIRYLSYVTILSIIKLGGLDS